ncbi:hypothetical protein Mame01_08440 [Microbispora amethystogenes]|nr:hypothetical protein Mame01_08440 [Microbispora amethystogenes]
MLMFERLVSVCLSPEKFAELIAIRVSMISPDLSGAEFRKSSFSGGGNNCVEVATALPGLVAVRDSKDRSGPVLTFTPSEWSAFIAGVKSGEFEI